jgi:hypothetical protein
MANWDAVTGLGIGDIATIAISAIALVAAVIANMSASASKAHDNRVQARNTVNGLCVKIAELSGEIQVFKVEQMQAADLTVYNTKVNSSMRPVVALATLARDILATSGIKAAPVEYALIAEAIALSGDPGAETMWTQAVSAARSRHDKIDLLQRYAEYLYTVGKADRGAVAYGDARAAMGAEATSFEIGRNLQMEAVANVNAGRADTARSLLAKAREHYEKVPDDARRAYALNSLESVRRSAFGET